jgi:phosphatidylglycerophosphatase C
VTSNYSPMHQRIAFFDFDGTITTKDTLLEFIKYSKGKVPFYLGFLINSPWLVAYKCKLIPNQYAKEKVLGWFFRNCPLDIFREHCEGFAAEVLPGLIRPKALQEIAKLQQSGAVVVVVSASPENWISGWTAPLKLDLIATRLELKGAGARLTGKIEGKNCYGAEKVRRIQEAYSLGEYSEIYAYGDSSGDRPMLKLGTFSFYRPFR